MCSTVTCVMLYVTADYVCVIFVDALCRFSLLFYVFCCCCCVFSAVPTLQNKLHELCKIHMVQQVCVWLFTLVYVGAYVSM